MYELSKLSSTILTIERHFAPDIQKCFDFDRRGSSDPASHRQNDRLMERSLLCPPEDSGSRRYLSMNLDQIMETKVMFRSSIQVLRPEIRIEMIR